jgi:Na+-transporting NADH:ubiquinone oxidoreductase subunit NqrB
MEADAAPPQKAPSAFIQFLTGSEGCGTNASGELQKMGLVAKVVLGCLILFFLGKLLSISKPQDPACSTGRRASVAVLYAFMGALTLFVFFAHASRCNTGFGFLLTIFLLALMEMLHRAIGCPTPEDGSSDSELDKGTR